MLRPARAALALVAVVIWLAAPAHASSAFDWPLAGEPQVGRRFQPPATAWGAGHRGVDLLGSPGAAVLAAAEGRVTYAGLLAGRGVVTVTHDGGLRTTYEPVDALVTVGEEVVRGEAIGLLATGHASCPRDRACLHWGLLRGSTYLDPLALLRRGHARLLPSTPEDRASTHARGAAPDGRALDDPGTTARGRTAAQRASTPPRSAEPRPARPVSAEPTAAAGRGDRAGSTFAAGVVLAGAGALAASRLRL